MEYLLAKNKDTGVIYKIRPDMLEVAPNPWILIDKDNKPIDTSPEVEKLTPKKPEERVILTKEGNPFKTEQAARSAMKRKDLSEDEWLVLPDGKDGFIITKV